MGTVADRASARTILLVCGSRALDRAASSLADASTEAWAREHIATRIDALPPGSIVLTGKAARGPDVWAASEARKRGLTLVEFAANGRRFENSKYVSTWWNRWYPVFPTALPMHRPLARNEAMIAAAKHAIADGWAARVLALVATWSDTRGTEHTAALARRNGVPAEVLYFGERGEMRGPPTRPKKHATRSPQHEPRVYFVAAPSGDIKIGYTTNVPGRIAGLQTSMSEPLQLLVCAPGGPQTEATLHARYKHLRKSGEWFAPGPDLVEEIERLRRLRLERPLTRYDLTG